MANRDAELERLKSDLVNLLTAASSAIVLVARDLTIRRFSAQAGKQLHLLDGDIGQPVGSVRDRLGMPDIEAFTAQVIATARARECEVRDEEGRWLSLRVQPYLTADNRVDGAVLVLVDIDAAKRSEQAAAARDKAEAIIRATPSQVEARENAEKFRLLFERSPLPKWTFELDTLRFIDVNEAALAHYGYSREEFLRMRVLDVCAPEAASRLRAALTRPPHHPPDEETCQHRTKHGQIIDVEVRGSELQLAGRRVWLASVSDITERRRAEQALRESHTRFEALFDASPVGMYLVDAQLRFRLVSRTARPVFGDIGELIDRDLGEVIHILWPPESADEIVADFRRTLETGEPYFAPEFSEERYDRSVREFYDWQIHRIVLPDGRYGVVCYFIDISERMRLSNELRQNAAELREADRLKTQFLATLAHELRNPLAPLRNALQIMHVASEDREAVRAALTMMERQVGQLVRLVDDLLDISRINRGYIELRRARIDLTSVVNQAVEAIAPFQRSKGQEVTIDVPAEPLYVHGDPTRLAQIVGNLLDNACKFTAPGGRIFLTLVREEAEAVLCLRDTGIGIAADQLPRIFDMFTQVDLSLERSQAGLGIGLNLVKTFVEMHEGRVEARSAGVGHGSEFVVRLPIPVEQPAQSQPPPAPAPAMAKARRRVLVVDDNLDAAESLVLLLELAGHEVGVAHDGLAAVDAAEAIRPEVVLLDIGLPKLNGHEVAQRIRAQAWGRDMVLIALTGWGQDADRQRSAAAGFNHHLVKPVEPVALSKLLADLGGPFGAAR